MAAIGKRPSGFRRAAAAAFIFSSMHLFDEIGALVEILVRLAFSVRIQHSRAARACVIGSWISGGLGAGLAVRACRRLGLLAWRAGVRLDEASFRFRRIGRRRAGAVGFTGSECQRGCGESTTFAACGGSFGFEN